MEKVICDSNIWYSIAEGKISTSTITNYELVLTSVILFEIAASRRFSTAYELSLKTCEKIRKHATHVYHTNPFNWLVGDLKEEPFSQYMYGELAKLGDNPHMFPKPNSVTLAEMGRKATEIENELEPAINWFNEYFIGKKGQLPEKYLRRKWKESIERKQASKELLVQLCSKALKKPITENDIDWERNHFFFTVFHQFLYRCESGELIMEQNDIEDFFNLIYVTEGAKYFTQDKIVLSTVAQVQLADRLVIKS